MESSQQLQQQHLAIESFSYSWLINLKPSFDTTDDTFGPSFDIYDEECFIEMDPKMARFKNSIEIQDFNFDCATVQPLTLVDADQIFADGLLVPLHPIATSTMQRRSLDCCSPISGPTDSPVSSVQSSTTSLLSGSTLRPAFFRRCRRYSRRIFLTCVGFLRPFCWRAQRRRTGRGMVGSGRRATRSCTESLPTTTRISTSSSASDCGQSRIMLASDVERSISEAVLHCKKSNREFGL